ncbi:kinase-like protein [Gigaspora margarita]|uniref:Kinase-like protein n=1 Tax=Gigaspora margarita TaxID=4874 RepID=A0A8H3X4N4_GIGMA|nr:kinase-like protein [Gigaspora margarita]
MEPNSGVSGAKIVTDVLINTGTVVPPIALAAVIFKEIIALTERAGHNKTICNRLADRIRVANQALDKIRLKDENDLALRAYVRAIEKCKNFIDKISKSSPFMKLIAAREIENSYNEITKEFDSAVSQLGLSTCLRTNRDIEDDQRVFHADIKTSLQVIEEVMQDMFENGMNNTEKLNALGNKLDMIQTAITNDKSSEADHIFKKSQIAGQRVTEHIENGKEVKRGDGQIVKKMMNGVQPVAQKEIAYIATLKGSDNSATENQAEKIEKIEKQVSILTELKNCLNIITFYGTTQVNGKLYIISEWAEMGDLNTYLKKNPGLPWDFKLRIASEIASGLAFCHFCDILHHDIRSHNILLTEKLTAKISNFSSSRKVSDYTMPMKNIMLIYRWLSPEKLANYAGTPYSKQCDIYSFSIVLWELASQEMPFSDVTNVPELVNRVTIKEDRPPLINGSPKAYEMVMKLGWSPQPIQRPTADAMFRELKALIRPPVHRADSTGLESIIHTRHDSVLSSLESDIQSEYSNMVFDDFVEILEFKPDFPDINEAKRLHSEKKYGEAYKIFKYHADHGDAAAEFYVGYYLISGDHEVVQDKELAVEYFRRSAEKNIPDAQFRYGVALLSGEGVKKSADNDKIAIEYLEKAAVRGNINAMFNYGDLLINGAHGVRQDLSEGARWLLKAHRQKHPHAYKKLSEKYKSLGMEIPQEITN